MTIVAVKPEAQGRQASFTCATPDTTLMYGALILLAGKIKDVERFAGID